MTTQLAISYADVPGFPAGSAVAHIKTTLTAGTPANSTARLDLPDVPSTVFSLAPDTYTYSVQGVDANGAPLGTAVTGTFTVAEPATVTLSLPSAVTVTQS